MTGSSEAAETEPQTRLCKENRPAKAVFSHARTLLSTYYHLKIISPARHYCEIRLGLCLQGFWPIHERCL